LYSGSGFSQSISVGNVLDGLVKISIGGFRANAYVSSQLSGRGWNSREETVESRAALMLRSVL
jgi:hypothetical protein